MMSPELLALVRQWRCGPACWLYAGRA